MICIDASVIVSAARGDEKYSEKSRLFLKNVYRERLQVFLPEIIVPEITSALVRAMHDPHFVGSFVDVLRRVPTFVFVPIGRNLADQAAKIILRTGLKSADAVYVALAVEYNLTLITLDREQLTKARAVVKTREPQADEEIVSTRHPSVPPLGKGRIGGVKQKIKPRPVRAGGRW